MSPNSFLSVLKTPPLSRLFGQGPDEAAEAEHPLRSELFALSQLESHGRLLAGGQQIDPAPGPEVLLERLKENERVIRESYEVVAEAVRKGRQTAPGADWLLDNYYLVEEQIDIAREHLPPGYSRQLPRLRTGSLKGFPRVYELALELVSHTDGRIDMENLSRFVRGVQTAQALALGELWAVPIMLRLALLENLRRVSYRVASRRRDRDRALVWARRFLEVVHTQPKALITELADFVRASPRMSQAFIAELCTGLQGQHPALSLVNSWIEQDLAEHGQTMDQILRAESHDQAADRVSIANSITSLRTLTALDWHEFVEDLSKTEAALRRDPSGVYATMDFATRDQYRHVVEELARWCRRPEHEVAVEAVRLAEERAADPDAVKRHRHVGWFLARAGRIELEHALGCRPPVYRRVGRLIRRWIPWVYVLGEAVATAVVTGALLLLTKSLIVYGWSWLAPVAVALLVFVSQSVIGLINWLATVLVPVRGLPRLNFSKGIPREHAAVVVVPTLLASQAGADSLVEGLEIRHLANRSPNLLFALLTDFTDAPQATMPDDEELVRRADAGVRELNAKYAQPGRPIFFLLHRPRLWNPAEGVWMGYERKRGKLIAFNQVLRGGPTDAYTTIVGNIEVLRTARYVIPLDTDTQLPPETAVKMVGSMAHPLNRPVMDPDTGCVAEGYGVLQPRVAIGLTGAGRSLFSRLFAGEVGIDPYTREVSNVYHDLFGRGQFIGKGIYDLEAFDRAVHDRFPENRILSHDLIEGCHAQCGFLNDVELIEDHPARYLADVKRRHRWVRGDWQIAPWLLPRVPAPGGRWVRNPLPRLSRWMVFDNLRRSLVPPIMLALLIGGWLALEDVQPAWTLWLLAVYFVPDVIRTLWAFVAKPSKVLWAAHVRRAAMGAGRQFVISVLHLAFLPFEAMMHVDAIGRVFWRTLISKRHLLQWLTAHHVERAMHSGLIPTLCEMWTAPVVVLLAVAALLALETAVPMVAWPVLALWLTGPLVAWFISRPAKARGVEFGTDQERFLRRVARRTWVYFEHFVGPNQNWLPPDNFQEQPQNRVTERTSPTNIGLALLSNLAAYDFGYVTSGALIERTEKTFATLERLPRYRNHFLNWYDTWTLEPLRPQYVSTVDSGNLACCLVALRGGLQELMTGPVIPLRWREGLEDVADVLDEEARKALDRIADRHVKENVRKVAKTVQDGLRSLSETGGSPAEVASALRQFTADLTDVAPLCQHEGSMTFWMAAMRRQAEGLLADLVYLVPWLADGEGNPHPTVAEPASQQADSVGLLREELGGVDTLRGLVELGRRLGPHIDDLLRHEAVVETPEAERLRHLRAAVAEASDRAAGRVRALEDLALQCEELSEIDVDFLYDPARKLLSIGFSLEGRHRDPGYYDLFASESRLCSYLGVAQGRLPMEHWFLLGRQLTPGLEMPTLMSWSGSMFEYLMPLLIMPNYEGTLLDQACHSAVMRQIKHGRRQRVPWGISESCYNQVDVQMNYQYRAFGVPELGLKRGLADDLVVAPYAATMALMVLPEKACANLQTLDRLGLIGRFGFYEAVDYTPSRVPADQDYAVVRCFMAHHGGMSFLALAYSLLGQPMQRRFMADPRMRANALLLQERIPAARASTRQEHRQVPLIHREQGEALREATVRAYADPSSAIPEVHLLSNGRYHVMVTSAGSGFSRWHDLALTRWREDMTRDHWGLFFYLHDLGDGHTWSCTHQPLARDVERYEAVFSQARAEFRTVHHEIDAHMQISVSPEDDVELRRITLTNLSNKPRSIELTSFAEVALAKPATDLAHPAFNSLFVQTETIPEKSAILCTRRPRSDEETPPWMFHAMIVHADKIMPWASFETDRARFLGRGRTSANPAALDQPGPLSNTAGSVLDPSIAIRRRLRLDGGEVVIVDAVAGVGRSRDEAVASVDRYHDRRLADRSFELAWTQSQVLLHQLRATEADALLFARLAASIVFANSRYRANASLLARNRKGQADLWRYGISGDLPIVLVRVTDQSGLELVRRTIQAHGYWRHKGLRVDLVIWVDAFAGYRQSLWDQIMGAVNAGPMVSALDQRGGVFVRSTDQLPEDDRLLLQSVARLVLSDRAGSLAEQADRRRRAETPMPPHRPVRNPEPPLPGEADLPPRDLSFFNGLGGFTPDGREYITILHPGSATPAPWANVLANPEFGSVVTESGGGYTWFENAHEYRLTPWYNDIVTDAGGETFYIRDEETGRFWSATPRPAPGPTPYVCRHGLGYTAFEHTQHNIFAEMYTYVATDAPVKFALFTLRNLSQRDRRLSVTGFCEWVLGQTRDKDAMHVVTRQDPQTGAIFASSAYSTDFADRIAFFQTSEADRSLTGDRTEFIGRNGSSADPAALRRQRLSDRIGAGLDPCAAIQAFVTVPAGQERQVVFILGAARGEQQAHDYLTRYGGIDGARVALETVWDYWKRLLGGVYVETPDVAVNLLANHWLLYQAVAGRFWGRSGLYQSGGAFGFRDQLQDVMAFLHECPHLFRQHLLTCAGRQFREGDVQHWWHPPTGRGVRTRFSDDYLWLPYAACRYVTRTGDTGVLDEMVPFLEGRDVEEGEESYYDLPQVTDEQASLYDHCVRAIRRSLVFGEHGLPLIGCGDWNDGLSRVGKDGKGESVWLAFFLYDLLKQFGPLAESRADPAVAKQCREAARTLQTNIETNAWDGRWYRRAYFDNGAPLGSAQSPECRIDSLPQSWAVLSGAAKPERAEMAMQSVFETLVDWNLRLVKLFDPPFDGAPWDPGYIKGYVPGVRENGGQYTHAAVWVAMAAAALKQTDTAWRLMSAINPIHHGDTPERIARYKVEPYVVAADVYTAAGHEGRGGWTWYTGSAAWMYRLLIESLLGLSLDVDTLTLAPILPPDWKGYTIHYRFRETLYHIKISVAGTATWNVRSVRLDDEPQPDNRIHLVDDRRDHVVRVQVG
ncbi:MAG TPA: glucoamylase family protein [Phycisphaerae bacterium]|nr:glucoamylase family protein [Phycisphaerae bacterium]